MRKSFSGFLQGLRYELRFWIFRLTDGGLTSSKTFYRLFESSLRLHRYHRAEVIAWIAERRCPDAADAQSMQCTLALRSGDLERGFDLMELRLQESDYRAVERLLFRTGSRPREESTRLAALAQLSQLPGLLQSHRCYALIAQGYLVLKIGEEEMAASLLVDLRLLILNLAADPDVYGCQHSNRRNRAKLLISLCTCSYHLALLVDDKSTLAWVWSQVMVVSTNLRYSQLNADACLRMSSNLCRCLALGTLLTEQQAPEALARSQEVLVTVEAEVRQFCVTSSGQGVSKTQENHLALMTQLQKAVKRFSSDDRAERDAGIRRLAQLINHSSARDLNGRIVRQLEQVDRWVG